MEWTSVSSSRNWSQAKFLDFFSASSKFKVTYSIQSKFNYSKLLISKTCSKYTSKFLKKYLEKIVIKVFTKFVQNCKKKKIIPDYIEIINIPKHNGTQFQ